MKENTQHKLDLMANYRTYLRRFLRDRRYRQHQEDAYDAFAGAVETVLKLDKFEGASVWPYLKKAADRRFLSRMRAVGVRVEHERRLAHHLFEPVTSPFADLVKQELDAHVQQVMARLNQQDRVLLHLFYWEQLSMNEIAIRMGYKNSRVAKVKKFRARQRFIGAWQGTAPSTMAA